MLFNSGAFIIRDRKAKTRKQRPEGVSNEKEVPRASNGSVSNGIMKVCIGNE